MSEPQERWSTGREHCAAELGKQLEGLLVKGLLFTTKDLARMVREQNLLVTLDEKNMKQAIKAGGLSEETLIRRCHYALRVLAGLGKARRKPARSYYKGMAYDLWEPSNLIEMHGRKNHDRN